MAHTPGTARGAKLAALLVDQGTSLVRTIFEDEVQKMNPPSLREQLTRHERHLKKLRYLNPGQRKTLYPKNDLAPDTAQGFDISLLELLLKELVPLELGRNAPYSGERDRLRQFRNNNYGHRPSTSLSEGEFDRLWEELTEILVALGRNRDEISERLNSSIDPEQEAEYFALLDQLYKEDMDIKHYIGSLIGEVLEKLKRWMCMWMLPIAVMAMVGVCAIGVGLYYLLSSADESSSWRDEASLLAHFPRRLKTFVGREDVFSRIDACLQENQTCLIKGLGGVGKTSVAIEYGHRRAERYPGGVFWVRLASKGDMCASISHYGLFLIDRGKETVHCNKDQRCESVTCLLKMYLTKSQDWLLVVDEALRNTTKDLESLLPPTFKANTHVLLSSQGRLRLESDTNFIPEVDLPPFSETEAQAMFNKTVRPSSKNEREEIKRLSRSLGHHPLALQFAFAFIEETGYSVEEYHDRYAFGNATEKVDLLGEADIANRGLRQVFYITFQYVSQLSSNAAKLLDMTSFMGPDCIPCPQPNSKYFTKLFNTSGKLDTKKMISTLKKFSLASDCSTFQPCAFSVNRIVQDVDVAQMNESMRVAHLENALRFFPLLLTHSNDTTRVQAELLMAHAHYLALNIGRYQLNVSITVLSIFWNRTAEFFCEWGACDDAYIFLHAQILLLSNRSSIQNLCYHLQDHVKFLNNTLLPCLQNSNVSSELLVYIAENLFWGGVKLDKLQPSYSAADACDIDQVKTSLESMSTGIYKKLVLGKKLPDFWSNVPTSFSFSVPRYRIQDSSHDTIFVPSPMPENGHIFWNPLVTHVAIAGRLLLIVTQNFLRFYADLIGLDMIELYVDCCAMSHQESANKDSVQCCNLIERLREELYNYRSTIKNATTKVQKVLFQYYRSMDTSACTNRYYEAMLGLPRESKEFNILEFARYDYNRLIGDPGVIKSVLSQKMNIDKRGRNPYKGEISPASYLAFHREVRWKYQLATMAHQLRETIDQSRSNVFPIQNCSALSVALAEMAKYRKIVISKLAEEHVLDPILQIVKTNLNNCLSLQSLNNKVNNFSHTIERYSVVLNKLNADISEFERLREREKSKLASDIQLRDRVDSVIAELELKRHEASLGLIDVKKKQKAEKKNIWKLVLKYSQSLSKLAELIGGNHFVRGDCLCRSPFLRSVFGCESFFPYTLWLWNVLQLMNKFVDCSLDHSEVDKTCFDSLMHISDVYMQKSISCFFRSKQNIKVRFGQPSSDGGEIFKFVQRDDRIVGLGHN